MNNKGFSLVELLAVIVILAIIMTLGFAGFGSIERASKEEMLKAKIESIETSAQKYGQENMELLTSKCKVLKEDYNFCKTITVEELLRSKYFSSEEFDNKGKNIVKNDVTGGILNEEKVCIYKKNNRVYAIMNSKLKLDAGDKCE